MTGSPYGVTPGGSWQPPAGPPLSPPPTQKPSRALAIISLVVAGIAVTIAIGSWFRPTNNEDSSTNQVPLYSEQEITRADDALCDAHAFITRATQTAGRQTSDDPAIKAAIAINIRMGSALAASYLLSKLDSHPGTSRSLAEAVRDLANAFQETTLTHLSDAPDTELDEVYERLNQADERVVEACE